MVTRETALEVLAAAYNESQDVLSGISDAYLYGSYARGNFDSESDIDILLLLDKTQEELSMYRMAVAEIASRLSLKYDITVSIVMKSKEQFHSMRYMPFYQNVISEGIRYAA